MGRLLREFQSHYAKYPNVDGIVQFLFLENINLVNKLSKRELTPREEDDLHEFWLYFMEHHGEETYEARKQKWPKEDPEILVAGTRLHRERVMRELENGYQSLEGPVKKEAERLALAILQIPADRFLTFTERDLALTWEDIPRSLSQGKRKAWAYSLPILCAGVIQGQGVYGLHLITRDKNRRLSYFILRQDPHGRWQLMPERQP